MDLKELCKAIMIRMYWVTIAHGLVKWVTAMSQGQEGETGNTHTTWSTCNTHEVV